jgi:hypothetical protein
MRTIQTRLLCGLLISCFPFLLLAACGGSGGSDGGSSAKTGTVSVALTDNQGLYNSVVLTIEKIGVVASNTPTTYYNSTDINELPVTVNVLDFPNEATLYLGDIEVPLPDNGGEVCFSQIRLVLADGEDSNYVIENDDPTFKRHPLKTPSGQQSGVKILVKEESFCLSEQDNAVNVTIEFDPETAIGFNENRANPYQLKPTSMRIIEGGFFTAPESFIDGLVAVPTHNTVGVCDTFSTDPLVTVAAYNSATLISKTVALAEGPFKHDVACEQWCGEDAPCLGACPLTSDDFCYYTGSFKLLLPENDTYDLSATWGGFSAQMPGVEYNSTVLLELEEQ